MLEGPTTAGYILDQMVRMLLERGQDPGPILAAASLDESELAEADTRVPLEIAWACWEQAYALCNDPLLGLAMAEQIGEGYPMLRYSLRNAGTLGDAFDRWCRFYALISDHGTLSLVRGESQSSLQCVRRDETRLPPVVEDWMVGRWLTLGRSLTGAEWFPLEVALEHPVMAEAAAYEQWFGAPVRFDADTSRMVIPDTALALPIRGSDPSASAVIDRHIEDVLARRSKQNSYTTRARAAMARQLDGGDPGAASVAKSLNVSERTLLRRLRDEGTTPAELLKQLRLELARKYLQDPAISLTEAAYLLGYSEVSAFHRAFKRWTGQTPADYRAQ